jgi:hypothetical protein
MVELGYGSPQDESEESFECGYRLVDTLAFLPVLHYHGAALALLAAYNCSTESTFPVTP